MEKSYKYFFILFLLFIIFFSLSTNLPKRHRGGFLSDESTYFSITQSLAYDYDLKYTRKDIVRIKNRFWVGPTGLFLKKGKNGGLFYAKSFAYPLFAAPFFRIFDVKGLLLFNGLMLFFATLMAFLLLKQLYSEKKSFLFSLIFIFASITPIYISWLTADLFNFFTMFAGLFFFFYKFKKPAWFYLSALFFSSAVFSKPSCIIPIGIIFLTLVIKKQYKKFILISLISIMLSLSLLLFLYSQTGEINFMGGERRTFYGKYPFEKPEYTFENGYKMSADNYWKRFYISPKVAILNLFYYFFGRFTGMFIYFSPAFFLFILFFFQRKIPEDWLILFAIIISSLVFILIAPENYFGGCGSVGNRYFLTLFPLFFFLGYKNRIFKFSLLPLFISILFLSGVYIDSFYHSTYTRYAGLSFPIKMFPPEKTQYQTLQTNENPRAFGKLLRHGQEKYWVHFLNDNFHSIEGNSFWTNSNRELELFLATPKRVKKFEVELTNSPVKNRAFIQIESKKKRVNLNPYQVGIITFKKVNGLRVRERYVYHIKVKSSKSFCAYFNNPANNDKRILGVKIHIGVVY